MKDKQKGAGRPPAGEKLKKHLVCFRTDDETFEQVKEACEITGYSMTKICKDATLKKVKSILAKKD